MMKTVGKGTVFRSIEVMMRGRFTFRKPKNVASIREIMI